MMPSSAASKKQMLALLTATSHKELTELITQFTGIVQLEIYDDGLLLCTPLELMCLTALEIRMIALLDPEQIDHHLKERAKYPTTLRKSELFAFYTIWSTQPKQLSLPELRKREGRNYTDNYEVSPVPRTEKLRRALCWLKQNNSLYRDVTESAWTLQLLENQERFVTQIHTLTANICLGSMLNGNPPTNNTLKVHSSPDIAYIIGH